MYRLFFLFFLAMTSPSRASTLMDYSLDENFQNGMTSFAAKNYGAAMDYFNKAKENPLARQMLGEMYLYGDGVKQDQQKAFEIFRSLESFDLPKSLYFQATQLWEGKGVKKDVKKALEYYQKSVDAGSDVSAHNLGAIYRNGTNVKTNPEKAFQYYKLAAERDFALSQFELAKAYISGFGVKKDEKQAFFWTEKAALKEIIPAQTLLGKLYVQGVGVERDTKLGMRWIALAAKKGDREALETVGRFMGFTDIDSDHNKAVLEAGLDYLISANADNSTETANQSKP